LDEMKLIWMKDFDIACNVAGFVFLVYADYAFQFAKQGPFKEEQGKKSGHLLRPWFPQQIPRISF